MLNKLEYYYRSLGVMIFFPLFSLGGALMAIMIFPFIRILSTSEEKCIYRTRHVIQLGFRLYMKMLILCRIIGFETIGLDRFKNQKKGCLIIANHPSILDVVMIMSELNQAQCIVKSELWDSPWLGGVVRSAGYIRNDGNPEMILDQSLKSLAEGQNIVIFPEGSRSAIGKPIKFQRGYANIAYAARADLQLVLIESSELQFLAKGMPWYWTPRKRGNFKLSVEDYIKIEDYIGLGERAKVVRRLTRDLEAFYSRKLEHA